MLHLDALVKMAALMNRRKLRTQLLLEYSMCTHAHTQHQKNTLCLSGLLKEEVGRRQEGGIMTGGMRGRNRQSKRDRKKDKA